MTDSTVPSASAVNPASVPLILPAPGVKAVLPPIPGGEENLLPISALTRDLDVSFPRWAASNPSPTMPETLTLLWNGERVAERVWQAPIEDDDLFILLPREHLKEGVHEVCYEVKLWSGNVEGSQALTITIDTTPPQYPTTPARLQFQPEVELVGITRRYLENNENQVSAQVPQYDFKPGDRLVAYWEELAVGENEVLEVELTADLGVAFDGDVIERLGNGVRYASYRLQDRAGNSSSLSVPRDLKVNIEPPALRPMPFIVEAQSGNPAVLDPKNSTGGVTARVPEQSDDVARTEITLFWKGYGSYGSFQTATPTTPGGLDFKIPPAAIPANLGRDVEVYYSVAFLDYPDDEPEVSETYLLRVDKLPAQAFPNISCAQAVNGVVSLAAVPGSGASITIPAWPYKAVAEGMRINVWMTGFDHQGAQIREDLLMAQPVPANSSPVTTSLAKAVLQQVKIATSFTLRAQVSFDKGDSYMSHRLVDLRLDP